MENAQQNPAKEHLVTIYGDNKNVLTAVFQKLNTLKHTFGFTRTQEAYETDDLAVDKECARCIYAIQFGIQNDALTNDELYSICLSIRLNLSGDGIAAFLESDRKHNNPEAGIHANRLILH